MHTQLRRTMTAAAVFAGVIGTFAWPASAADAPNSIRIGYAVTLSGALAPGRRCHDAPRIRSVGKGRERQGRHHGEGIGKRIPVEEVAKYDDTGSAETLLRLEEKPMSQDKVDFVLPPYSTAFNLAVAPIFARYGYPELAVTANSMDEEQLVNNSPCFLFLNQPPHFGGALIEILNKYKGEGKISNKAVLLSVGDQFGAESSVAWAPGSRLRVTTSCCKRLSAGTNDVTTEIKEAKVLGADSFIAASYPPDTFS